MQLKHLFAVLSLLTALACNETEPEVKPHYADITEWVYASATVRPVEYRKVYAGAAGIVRTVAVKEGETVKKGDVLYYLIDTESALNAGNAKLSYQLASDNLTGNANALKELEQELLTARQALALDSLTNARLQNLRKQQIGSQAEADNAALKFESSRRKVRVLEIKQLRLNNEISTQMKQAENSYLASVKRASDFAVRASMDGKVYSLTKKEGEMIGMQEPVATLGRADDFLVELLIDESDITKVKVGSKVFVTLDAFSDKVFEATLSTIYPEKNIQNQTFKAEATLVNPPDRLYSGLAGEANIESGSRKQVLCVPLAYLQQNKVLTDKGLVEVKTGLRNLEFVEIISGLDTTYSLKKPAK